MPQLIEVTGLDGARFVVNLDLVRHIKRVEDPAVKGKGWTNLTFGRAEWNADERGYEYDTENVRETPRQILMAARSFLVAAWQMTDEQAALLFDGAPTTVED